MPPARKSIPIEEYRPFPQHPAVKISLDGSYFRARVGDSALGAPSLDELKKEIYSRIEVLVADLPWTPVIHLTLHHEGVRKQSDGDPLAAAVSMDVERYHIAIVDTPKDGRRDDARGSWSGKLVAPWEKKTPTAKLRASKNWYFYFDGPDVARYDAPRSEDGTLALPSKIHASHAHGEVHLLHYSEETWTGLMALVSAIHQIRHQLRTIAGDAELVRRLSQAGAQMLSASRLLGAPALPARALNASHPPAEAAEADFEIIDEPPKPASGRRR